MKHPLRIALATLVLIPSLTFAQASGTLMSVPGTTFVPADTRSASTNAFGATLVTGAPVGTINSVSQPAAFGAQTTGAADTLAGLTAQLQQLQTQLMQLNTAQTNTTVPTNPGGTLSNATNEILDAAFGGQAVATQTGTTLAGTIAAMPVIACPVLDRALGFGATGDDVTMLQKFLVTQGLLNAEPTGFFGALTTAAVQKFQAQNGIVSAGDAATTGFGMVGKATRGWITKRCGGTNQNFSAYPTSGPAPLAVSFSAPISDTNVNGSMSVDFGDGATGSMTAHRIMLPCAFNVPCPARGSWDVSHTYTKDGTYTATLTYQPPMPLCPSDMACAQVMPAPVTVGTATITVGAVLSCPMYTLAACPVGQHWVSDGPKYVNNCPVPNGHCEADGTAGAPTVSGVDGPASLNAGQQGAWTVHANISSGADQNLKYGVVWGDEGLLGQLMSFAADMSTQVQASGTFTHAYSAAGTYAPRFTVSNSAGSNSASASVVVGGGGVCTAMYRICPAGTHNGGQCNQDCIPDTGGTFSATPVSGAAPLAVTFSSDTSGVVDFGDGTSGTVTLGACTNSIPAHCWNTVSHTYAKSGTYTATLQTVGACSAGQCAQTQSVTIAVVGGIALCPQVIVDCAIGYHPQAQNGTDANGCSLPTQCVPDVITSCPMYNMPACPAGQHLGSSTKNANGCTVPGACVPDTKPLCPMIAVDCAQGYQPVGQGNDANNCPLPAKCVLNPSSCTAPSDGRVYANGQSATYSDWCSANSLSVYCGTGTKLCQNGQWVATTNAGTIQSASTDSLSNLASAALALESAIAWLKSLK